MLEKKLQEKFIKLCKNSDILVYKFASPSNRGVPDLILIKDGKTIFVELKSPTGKGRLSELQKRTIDKMRKKGVVVYVTDNIDAARALIKKEFDC